MASLPEKRIIVGDFNLTLDMEKDRRNCSSNNDKAKAIVDQLMSDFLLCNIWRTHNLDSARFSYFARTRKVIVASRIDFTLVSLGLDSQVELTFYLPGLMTHHSAFFMSINPTMLERERGYWKFNNLHLSNFKFVKMMNSLITERIELYKLKDPKSKWESLKFDISNSAQKFARNLASDHRIIINQLYIKVNELEEQLADDMSDKTAKLLTNTRSNLEDCINQETQRLIFRSKAKYFTEAERNSNYFFSLEKAKYNSKVCSSLLADDGSIIKEQKTILKMQENYYRKLYSSNKDIEFQINDSPSVQTSQEESDHAEQQITFDEMSNALKGMSNDKCPGLDGLSVNFYKFFCKSLGPVLFQAIQQGITDGLLHDSALKGIINLITKVNKDMHVLKNLRPITLLNVDYKILEKVLANRLKINMNKINNQDQKGFMQNRRISSNIRKILDLMDYAEEYNLEAVITSVDFEKCFDKVKFEAIFGALQYFGYSPAFIQMVHMTYAGFSASPAQQLLFK